MSNATLIYEGMKSFADIKGLIGSQETLFIDFKTTKSIDGKLSDDDKKNFSKAASGFAHQEGGVIVWGIRATKDDNGVDHATKLAPIKNPKVFKQELESYIKIATEPVLDGIINKTIFDNDTSTIGLGYIISFFPRSNTVHRALGKNEHDFYKRHGDGFVSLSTSDIKALFFREIAPDLELFITPHWRCFFNNLLGGFSKNATIYIGFPEKRPETVGWFDEAGNNNFPLGRLVKSGMAGFEKSFMTSPGIVIHPGEELTLFTFAGMSNTDLAKFSYKIFA